MIAIHTFLMTLVGCAAAFAIAGMYRRYPDRHTVRALIAVALVALAGAVALTAFKPRPDCYYPAHVQAVWLDSAWRCIPTEQAG